MMKVLKNKFVLGCICFFVGALSMFGVQKITGGGVQSRVSHSRSVDPLLDQFFNDDFFGRAKDPFEEMRRMRKRMLEDFDQAEGGGLFDSWYKKKFGGTSNEITQREDDHFLYYEIAVDGLKQDKVNVTVSDGQLSISGQTEKKSEDAGTHSYMTSSFHRSFPVPSNVDSKKMEMEQQKDKIVIKFPKLIETNT